jgi:hypothetical protein
MRRGKEPDQTVMLTPAQARDLVVLFSVRFDPGEPEQLRKKPQGRIVLADVAMDDDLHCGQATVMFCGTKCLRRWLNRLVDDVERNSRVGPSRRDPDYRITKFDGTPETEPRRPTSRRRTGKR